MGDEHRSAVESDQLAARAVPGASFDAPAVWLLYYPTRAYVPLKVRVFVDFLLERFADAPPWDRPSREGRFERLRG